MREKGGGGAEGTEVGEYAAAENGDGVGRVDEPVPSEDGKQRRLPGPCTVPHQRHRRGRGAGRGRGRGREGAGADRLRP